jgi:hypothetical protein
MGDGGSGASYRPGRLSGSAEPSAAAIAQASSSSRGGHVSKVAAIARSKRSRRSTGMSAGGEDRLETVDR